MVLNTDDEMAFVDYGMVSSLMFLLLCLFCYCTTLSVMIFFHVLSSMFMCVIMDIPKIISLVKYLQPKVLFTLTKCQ